MGELVSEHFRCAQREFWLPQKEKLLRNSISLLLLVKEPIRMRHVYEMIVTSPVSIEQTRSEEWHKSSYLFQLFARADRVRNHAEWPLLENTGSIHQPIGNQSQTSVQELEEEVCPPKEFVGSRNGGRRNSYIVEGILFQSGRLWKGDQRWTVRKFKQLNSV